MKNFNNMKLNTHGNIKWKADKSMFNVLKISCFCNSNIFWKYFGFPREFDHSLLFWRQAVIIEYSNLNWMKQSAIMICQMQADCGKMLQRSTDITTSTISNIHGVRLAMCFLCSRWYFLLLMQHDIRTSTQKIQNPTYSDNWCTAQSNHIPEHYMNQNK